MRGLVRAAWWGRSHSLLHNGTPRRRHPRRSRNPPNQNDPVAEALDAAVQILDGLGAAHSLTPPVLHRDVTPLNVLVATGTPLLLKLSDFGLASHVNQETRLLKSRRNHSLPATRSRVGIRDGIERSLRGWSDPDELLTGVAAFAVDAASDLRTSVGIAAAIRDSRQTLPPPPSRYRPGLPPAVNTAVLKALAPNPEDRFRWRNEFKRTLTDILARRAVY